MCVFEKENKFSLGHGPSNQDENQEIINSTKAKGRRLS